MFLSQSLFAPRLSYTVNSGDFFFRSYAVCQVRQQAPQGLAVFLFCGVQMVSTLQNHAIAGCVGLFAGLEKRPFHAGLRGVLMNRPAAF